MGTCNGTAEQNWAIEADETIRINGKCMDIYREEKPAKPRSSRGPAPAAPTSNDSHAMAPWSTPCRAMPG
jgi:hypothetical protein